MFKVFLVSTAVSLAALSSAQAMDEKDNNNNHTAPIHQNSEASSSSNSAHSLALSSLPQPAWESVFAYLEINKQDVKNIRLVCKNWKEICTSFSNRYEFSPLFFFLKKFKSKNLLDNWSNQYLQSMSPLSFDIATRYMDIFFPEKNSACWSDSVNTLATLDDLRGLNLKEIEGAMKNSPPFFEESMGGAHRIIMAYFLKNFPPLIRDIVERNADLFLKDIKGYNRVWIVRFLQRDKVSPEWFQVIKRNENVFFSINMGGNSRRQMVDKLSQLTPKQIEDEAQELRSASSANAN